MFELHEKLAADTVPVVEWPLCRVLLMKDANYPWLILVPRRHGIQEIHELDNDDSQMLMEEMRIAAHTLQNSMAAHKINIGALGNMVPQLHVHVIARYTEDLAWPRPVWGAVAAKPYEDAALTALRDRLRDLLGKALPPCC